MKQLITLSLFIITLAHGMNEPFNVLYDDQPLMIPLDDVDTDGFILKIHDGIVKKNHINDSIELFYDNEGFFVREKENDVRVHSYDTDKLFRDKDLKQIAKYACLAKFKVSKFDTGEYAVSALGDLKGGGVIGAALGAFLGKAAVSVVGHGAIYIVSGVVSIFCPPAGLALGIALESTCGAAIELASIKGAIAGGIAGGVATGPI